MDLFVILDPVSALLLHLLHDFIALIFQDLGFNNFAGNFKIVHELHASLTPFLLSILHSLNGIAHLLLNSHGPAGHAQEEKLFLADAFDLLPG